MLVRLHTAAAQALAALMLGTDEARQCQAHLAQHTAATQAPAERRAEQGGDVAERTSLDDYLRSLAEGHLLRRAYLALGRPVLAERVG